MNMHFTRSALMLALCATPIAGFASTYDGECTDKPKSEWMSVDAVKASFEQQGYTVGKVKSSGSCYEVYTRDKDGNKVEYFVSPADASVVGQAKKK